jgi:hypothetical protein
VLLIFLGVTAVGGGLALVLGTTEAGLLPPDSWLEALPIVESWRVPGLVLGIGFGLGSLLTAYGVVRRPDWGWADFVQRPTGHHWSWLATILLGLGHVVWIGIEMVFLPELSILQAIYGPLGLALAILPFAHPVSEYLSLR